MPSFQIHQLQSDRRHLPRAQLNLHKLKHVPRQLHPIQCPEAQRRKCQGCYPLEDSSVRLREAVIQVEDSLLRTLLQTTPGWV
jgi:hypothetical protein